MKRFIALIIVMLFGFQPLLLASDNGDGEEYELPVQGDSDNNVNDEGTRHKSKGEMFHCVISRHGVTVNGTEITSSISIYEISDENGICIAVKTDSSSCIDSVKSLPSGTYQLKFQLTSGHILSGWIYL